MCQECLLIPMQEGLTSFSANIWILQGVNQFSTELIAVFYIYIYMHDFMAELELLSVNCCEKHLPMHMNKKNDNDAKEKEFFISIIITL